MTDKTAEQDKMKNQNGGPGRIRKRSLDAPTSTPGYKLAQAIIQRASEEGLATSKLAEITGISEQRIYRMRTGKYHTTLLSRDELEAVATWLNYPLLAVMIMSEQVSLRDFYSPRNDIDNAIANALDFISKDAEWGGLMPKELEDAPMSIKLWSIWAFERATGHKLISGAIDYIELMKEITEFRTQFPLER